MPLDPRTFDICLGESVLVTVVGQDSADLVTDALTSATLFQCEGLRVSAREVDRTAPLEPIPEAEG